MSELAPKVHLESIDSLKTAVDTGNAAMAWRLCRAFDADERSIFSATFIVSAVHGVAMIMTMDGLALLDCWGKSFFFARGKAHEVTGKFSAQGVYDDLVAKTKPRLVT